MPIVARKYSLLSCFIDCPSSTNMHKSSGYFNMLSEIVVFSNKKMKNVKIYFK